MNLAYGLAERVTGAKEIAREVNALAQYNSLTYNDADAEPGDVFFHVYSEAGATHGNMVSPDRTQKIDSVVGAGVRTIPMAADRHARIGFRLMDSIYAQNAALLLLSWVGQVGYSSGLGGMGRQIHAGFGASNFGKGAVGRLHKYADRGTDGNLKAPKNSTCGELCILAYQLCIPENDPMFPKLDAKHSSPNRIVRYMLANPSVWDYLGYRGEM
ncbi:MAG: hypothetical protein PGN09_06510 [Sphingomonas fennica]